MTIVTASAKARHSACWSSKPAGSVRKTLRPPNVSPRQMSGTACTDA